VVSLKCSAKEVRRVRKEKKGVSLEKGKKIWKGGKKQTFDRSYIVRGGVSIDSSGRRKGLVGKGRSQLAKRKKYFLVTGSGDNEGLGSQGRAEGVIAWVGETLKL